MGIEIRVDLSGPISDGLAPEIVGRFVTHITEYIGDMAVERIRAYLPTQYMYLGHNGGSPRYNPIPGNIGNLQAHVSSYRVMDDVVKVWDGGYPAMIYGPWIEGIAPGNYFFYPGRVKRGLSPRFPGYHSFRKITQEINFEATIIVNREFRPYLGELNG